MTVFSSPTSGEEIAATTGAARPASRLAELAEIDTLEAFEEEASAGCAETLDA